VVPAAVVLRSLGVVGGGGDEPFLEVLCHATAPKSWPRPPHDGGTTTKDSAIGGPFVHHVQIGSKRKSIRNLDGRHAAAADDDGNMMKRWELMMMMMLVDGRLLGTILALPPTVAPNHFCAWWRKEEFDRDGTT
jgi:hypothetical protein